MAIPDESDFSCLHPTARVKFDGGKQAVVCDSCHMIVTYLGGDAVRVAELEAVIERALKELRRPDAALSARASTADMILSASPSGVLGEHDREVRADELCAWADWIENASGTVPPLGVSPFDLGTVVRAMRSGQRPFGASAAAIRNGEHA